MDDPINVTKHMRKPTTELKIKYDDPKKFDKVAEVESNLNEVRVVVENNIRKVANNIDSLEVFEWKSLKSRRSTQGFLCLDYAKYSGEAQGPSENFLEGSQRAQQNDVLEK